MFKNFLSVISILLLTLFCGLIEVTAQIKRPPINLKNSSQNNTSPSSSQQTPKLIMLLDENNDTVITLKEAGNMQKVFNILDVNRDGKLSRNEYYGTVEPEASRLISKTANDDSLIKGGLPGRRSATSARPSGRSATSSRPSGRSATSARPSGRSAISSGRKSVDNRLTARSSRVSRKSPGGLSGAIKRPNSRINSSKPVVKDIAKPASASAPEQRSIGKKSENIKNQNNKAKADSNFELVVNLETRLKDLVELARLKYKDISKASDKQKVLNFMRRDSRKFSSEIVALKSKYDSKKIDDILERIKELELILK